MGLWFILSNSIFIKNVTLNEGITHDLVEGLEKKNRIGENGENHVSLMGTKQQINTYLQDKPIISERLRTLNDIPHYRIINTKKIRIQ